MQSQELVRRTDPATKSWELQWGFGAAVGAFSVLGSGEVAMIGAGGVAAFGETLANSFAGASGVIGAVGAAMDPGAMHSFLPRKPEAPCRCHR